MYLYHALMSTVNAWLVHRCHCERLNQKNADFRQFQASIAQFVTAVGRKPVGRPSSFGIPASKNCEVYASSPDDKVHEDGVGHMPVWGTNRLSCRHCCPAKNFFLSFIVASAVCSYALKIATVLLHTICKVHMC